MLLQQRAARLYEQLDRELLNFAPGSRFYSARQLVLRYGVSRRVVAAALAELEKRGAIEIQPQSGIFVRQSGAHRRVTLFMVDWPSESQKRWVLQLESEIEKFGGIYDFSIRRYVRIEEAYDLLKESCADLNIFAWSGGVLSREAVQLLAALKVPTVVLWFDLGCLSFDSVSGMGDYGGMLAAAALLRKGHRKLAILPSEPFNQDVFQRSAGFSHTARLFGASLREIECHVQPGEYALARAHDELLAYLEKHGCDFTGLFVVSDESAQGALAALREFGLRVPEDVSVVGYGNVPLSGYYTPALTSVDGRTGECMRQLALAIHRRLSGEDSSPINIRVKPKLVERDSILDISRNRAGK